MAKKTLLLSLLLWCTISQCFFIEDSKHTCSEVSYVTCGYGNINGHRIKYLRDKLLDRGFLEGVTECDIIGLREIQSEGEVEIPGFKSSKQKVRDKTFVGPNIAGGIRFFC